MRINVLFQLLSDTLKVGKARHWKDVIKMLSRGYSTKITSDAMLEYFQPLMLWLKAQNKDERIVGWTTSKEDNALFQPWIRAGTNKTQFNITIIFIFVIIVKII